MLTMRSSLRGTAVVQGRRFAKASRGAPKIVAFTDWKLEPEPKWCKDNADECSTVDQGYDLCTVISEKMKSVMETSLQPGDSISDDKAAFSVMCEKTGINVSFESTGNANPVDTTSSLYIKNLGSQEPVAVDGQSVEKDATAELKPGAIVVLGKLHFQVTRDVRAHA